MRYTTTVPSVTSETFDGEVVVANFVSGAYYSLSGSAAAVYDALKQGLAPAEIADWLGAALKADPAVIVADVQSFVDHLMGEQLVAEAPNATAGTPPALTIATYAAPIAERFDDLVDLLLLDPVHDVTEAGWPHLPPTTENT